MATISSLSPPLAVDPSTSLSFTRTTASRSTSSSSLACPSSPSPPPSQPGSDPDTDHFTTSIPPLLSSTSRKRRRRPPSVSVDPPPSSLSPPAQWKALPSSKRIKAPPSHLLPPSSPSPSPSPSPTTTVHTFSSTLMVHGSRPSGRGGGEVVPLITPTSALASTLSSFTFVRKEPAAAALLSPTLECREALEEEEKEEEEEKGEGEKKEEVEEDGFVVVRQEEGKADEKKEAADDDFEEWEREEEDGSSAATGRRAPHSADDDAVECDDVDDETGYDGQEEDEESERPRGPKVGGRPLHPPHPTLRLYQPDDHALWVTEQRGVELISTIPSILDPLDPDTLLHMYEREARYHPSPQYLALQPHLDPEMRPVLLDWMVEVSQEFGLQRETLHAAANFVDRFLSLCPAPKPAASSPFTAFPTTTTLPSSLTPEVAACAVSLPITRLNFQLLGISSLFLASKMEEIYPPTAADFATTTDGAYHTKEVAGMERLIAEKLDWRLQPVTSFAWVKAVLKRTCLDLAARFDRRISAVERAIKEGRRKRTVEELDAEWSALSALRGESLSFLLSTDLFTRCMELLDATLLDVSFLSFLPSALSASALLLVYAYPPHPAVIDALLSSTIYSFDSLLPCMRHLCAYSCMEYRGPVKTKCYFGDVKERVEERWGRQSHWRGMLDMKRLVEKGGAGGGGGEGGVGGKVETVDGEGRGEVVKPAGRVEVERGGGGGLECDEEVGEEGVGESSLSSFGGGLQGVALTSSLPSQAEWSEITASELDRRVE